MKQIIYRLSSVFILILLFGFFGPAFLFSQDLSWEGGNELSRAEGRRILSKADELISYEDRDFSAEYTVIDVRPGEGTSRTKLTLFRRDLENTYTIIIMEPESDRGKGYLRKDDKLWLYDPVPRRFTVVNVSDRFRNTNLRNSDFTKSTLAQDFKIVDHTREKLGVYDTDVYALEAVHDDVTFPKKKIWIDQNDLVRKMEDYSLSGRHMRTTAVPNYTQIERSYVPVRMVIQDELRGRNVDGEFKHQRTLISVEKPSFQELPDMVFTRAYIERVGD